MRNISLRALCTSTVKKIPSPSVLYVKKCSLIAAWNKHLETKRDTLKPCEISERQWRQLRSSNALITASEILHRKSLDDELQSGYDGHGGGGVNKDLWKQGPSGTQGNAGSSKKSKKNNIYVCVYIAVSGALWGPSTVFHFIGSCCHLVVRYDIAYCTY